MTREELIKYRFKAYMEIDYRHLRMEEPIRCMLVSVNFDDNVMIVCPIDPDYENKDFTTSTDYCFMPPKPSKESKLKII